MIRYLALLLAALATVSIAVPMAQFTSSEMSNLTAQGGPRKRGIAYNDPAVVKLFDHPNSKAYWMYNWYSAPGNTGMWYEYIPMLHSNRPDHTSVWIKNIRNCAKQGTGPIHVLSFNEPDQCGNGGACMQNVGDTTVSHRQWMKEITAQYGRRLFISSPAVTNGAKDPNGNIMGLGYLNQFMKQCADCKIDYIAIHWYDSAKNIEYFKNHLWTAHKQTGRKIWVTEFGPKGSEAEIINFLKVVLPWMDKQDWIFRYAMQWAAPGELVNARGTGLSRIGHVYNTI